MGLVIGNYSGKRTYVIFFSGVGTEPRECSGYATAGRLQIIFQSKSGQPFVQQANLAKSFQGKLLSFYRLLYFSLTRVLTGQRILPFGLSNASGTIRD